MSMSKYASIEDYTRERNEALRTMNLEWAREMLGATAREEVLLMSMHKARYECTDIEPELRQASRKWLEERGCTRFNGIPWPSQADDISESAK
jgi:hypothetical protein